MSTSDYSEDAGYVNIHGQDVKVYVCEKTGRILIPIDELKRMGFRIYRKSQYSKLLIDDNQFNKEFNLYMLQSAQTYMLENKITFNQNDILECIDKCKTTLTGNQSDFKRSPKFTQNHIVETSDDSLKITTNLRQPFSTYAPNTSPQELTKSTSPTVGVRNLRSLKPQSGGFNQQNNNFSEQSKPQQQLNGFADSKPNFKGSKQDISKNLDSQFQNQIPDKIETIKLHKKEHEVIVSFIEKPNFLWVQDFERAEALVQIDAKVKAEVEKQEKKYMKFALNTIYLASDEGMWFRCKVIKFKPLTVFFVDYGNTAQVTDIREASRELAEIPAQALKITFQDALYKPRVFERISIQVKKSYENGTYLVDIIKTESVTSSSTSSLVEEKQTAVPHAFFTKPRPLCGLEHGQRVMIISHNEGKLALRTKECYDKLKTIETALETVACSAHSIDSVKIGQLVLCKRDKFYRAVVKEIRRNEVELELLDYYENISVDLSKLKAISESLAKEAVTFILTPTIKNYNGVDEIIQDMIDNRTKASVVVSNGEFDLNLGNELLSNKLKPQLQKRSDRPMITDLKAFKPKLGVEEYILNVYNDKDDLYFAFAEALEEHLDNVIKSEIDDDEPYEPVVGEVCLGLYQDNWCRCAVLNVIKSQFEVSFIDFGNLEILKSAELRKLTADGKTAPILAFQCQLVGLPSRQNVEEVLKECFVDGESYEVDIKKFNGKKYEIEIPVVNAEL